MLVFLYTGGVSSLKRLADASLPTAGSLELVRIGVDVTSTLMEEGLMVSERGALKNSHIALDLFSTRE